MFDVHLLPGSMFIFFLSSGAKNNLELMGQSTRRPEPRHLGKIQRIGRGL